MNPIQMYSDIQLENYNARVIKNQLCPHSE